MALSGLISSVISRIAAYRNYRRTLQALSALDQPKDYTSESKLQAAPRPPSGVHRPVEPSGRAF